MPIVISQNWTIPDEELSEAFFQSAGPGGQNVNKVATAVRLSFDLAHAPSVDVWLRGRLLARLAGRLDSSGVLAVVSREHRTQLQNRAAAERKLAEILIQALVVPKKRRPTKPTKASKERRLQSKKRHSELKNSRRVSPGD